MASKALVESLYEALQRGDTAAVAAMMAEDVEWWFHGPRRCQYMRKLLTGEDGHQEFRFRPRAVAEVGGRWVVAEGWEGKHAYWVHAWAVEGGVITRFREYFNTSVTVHQVGGAGVSMRTDGGCTERGSPATAPAPAPTLWQSKVRMHHARSMPGLVLAI